MNRAECASSSGTLLQMVETVFLALEVAWSIASGNTGEFRMVKSFLVSSLRFGSSVTSEAV